MMYLSLFTGKLAVIDQYVCGFSTKVSGESMNPLVAPGSLIELNRCFKKEDLTEGVIVLFSDNSNLRLGVIRHVIPLDPVVYKISDEKAPELFHDIVAEEIVAMTKNIDTSKSKYQVRQGKESFILNSDEFLRDIYLGRIAKGMGIEMSTVEKITTFFRQEDKFCAVVVPKKNLTAVDIEISDTKTLETISLGRSIVYDSSSKPTNINCMDFGSNQGMLNLDPGTYQYKFIMNNQVLANIQFEVK